MLARSTRAAWLAGLAALAMAMAAPAQAQFGTPFTVAKSADALDPKVAVDADGDAVFAWRRHDGTNWRIQARSRSKTGELGPVQSLSEAGQNATLPKVAIDAEGDAVIVWQLGSGTNALVQARTLSAGGTRGPILTLSADGARDPQVAVDGDGDSVVVWLHPDESGFFGLVQARGLSKAGVLAEMQTLAQGGRNPRVAMDADGDALIVWQDWWSDAYVQTQARSRSKTGVLGPVRTLSDNDSALHDADFQQVAVSTANAGQAVVTWGYTYGYDGIEARHLGLRGSPIYTISANPSLDPQVAMGAHSNAVFAWQDKTSRRIQARAFSKFGSLGPVQSLSAALGKAYYPRVAMDAEGNAVVVWHRFDRTRWRVQARWRSASGVLGSTQTLSAAGQSAGPPQVAVAPNGKAVVTWHGADPRMQGHRIFAAATP